MAKSDQLPIKPTERIEPIETAGTEEAYRASVAREWIAQSLVWERQLRAVSETAAAARSTEVASPVALKIAS